MASSHTLEYCVSGLCACGLKTRLLAFCIADAHTLKQTLNMSKHDRLSARGPNKSQSCAAVAISAKLNSGVLCSTTAAEKTHLWA